MWAAALALIGCSSSDDVVATLDEPPATAQPAATSGGAPLVTSIQSVTDPAARPGVAGSLPAGIGWPPPPGMLVVVDDALFVSGTPNTPPLAGAERWPLATPLRLFFLPAGEQEAVVVPGPASKPLRELGARHGLDVDAPAQVRVEDDAGDQYELVLSEEPPFAGHPLPAEE